MSMRTMANIKSKKPRGLVPPCFKDAKCCATCIEFKQGGYSGQRSYCEKFNCRVYTQHTCADHRFAKTIFCPAKKWRD